MASLITVISTKKPKKKTKRRGAQAFCLLVMVGLNAPKSKEENKKKRAKRLHLYWGHSPAQLHLETL
jgi:hypothetical protein